MQDYSIIIPTRNRETLLNNLVGKIDFNDSNLLEVIVVDSSDELNKSFTNQAKIKYIFTSIKSAARQRNIGIDNLIKANQNVFFVDDDVILPNNYFKKLNECLLDQDTVGASGLAINMIDSSIRIKPHGLKGLYKRIFLLDSKRDGALLRSAINIPIRPKNGSLGYVMETEWLIGCSAWKFAVLSELRFEDKFVGQSLGEDVLFSSRAKKNGKLKVNTNIVINHLESNIERPNIYNFYKMWVSNRFEISKQLRLSWFNMAFHWANIGKCLLVLIRGDLQGETKKSIIAGIVAGYRVVFLGFN